ncbi:MAG: hypothetical protein LBC98_07165 [Prevotellaceae bacterium]|jgi:hypothetical protein|nr:hypothetical protein [Prevotellaceae bacterium]
MTIRNKEIILYTLAILTLGACNERAVVSDADGLGLRGKIKSMNEEFFIGRSSFDKIVPEKSLYKYSYSFDYWGKYLEVEKYYEFSRTEKPDSCAAVGDSICNSTVDSLQNQHPTMIKEPQYVLEKYKYVSDSTVIVNVYDETGKLSEYEERHYKNGKLTSVERFSACDDVLLSKESFLYDLSNRLINKTVFYPKNYVESKYRYSRNKKYESYNYSFKNYAYRFDLNGLTVEKETYSGNVLLAITKYSYNDYGDLVAEQESDMLAKAMKETGYEYEYDASGNWTLCVERRPDGNIFIRKRNMIYY